MTRGGRYPVGILLALALTGPPSAAVGQSVGSTPLGDNSCRPADAEAGHLAGQLRRVLSSADSADAELRRRVGITYQPSPYVAQVTEEGICAQAVTALNGRTRTPGKRRQVYLYDLGSQYAVDDPEQMAGEYRMLRIFSRAWELRGDILVY
jgi:hypothetical protein